MDCYETFADLVSRISYKPGWRFTLTKSDFDRFLNSYVLLITAAVQDSRNPEQTVEFVMKRMVPEYLDSPDMFLKWVMHVLKECEIHEMREFFRFDGKLLDDPHATKQVTV